MPRWLTALVLVAALLGCSAAIYSAVRLSNMEELPQSRLSGQKIGGTANGKPIETERWIMPNGEEESLEAWRARHLEAVRLAGTL